MKRHVPLDGSFNFRDAGGLETRDGRRMKPGILYRSDELSRLSDGDLERLGGLGLRSICDLRAPGERRRRPDRLPPGGVRPVHVPFQLLSETGPVTPRRLPFAPLSGTSLVRPS